MEDRPHLKPRWYLWLDLLALVLMIGAIIAFAVGVSCLPSGGVNEDSFRRDPAGYSSWFNVLAISGSFQHLWLLMFEIGGVLALCAAALKLAIRATFRAGRG